MDGPTPNLGRRATAVPTRRVNGFSRAVRAALVVGGVGLFAVACTRDENPTLPKGAVRTPNFGLTDPRNGPGACMGDDAISFGQTSGLASATGLNCTANDIDVASADIISFSFDNINFTPLAPGARVDCAQNDTIFVETVAHLQNNATARYDIGVWIASAETNDTVTFSNGRKSNAVTGACTHYNLTKDSAGVANLDGGDACGDMSSGGLTSLRLDVLKVACKPDQDG